MFIKHLFGLFTMIFFVVLSSGIENKSIFNITKNAFLLYILFILITKCQIYAFLIILLLLGISYIVHITKQTEIENDEKTEKKDTEKKYTVYDNIMYVLYILIIITIIVGVILYMGEKKIEYKKNFNYVTFLIGKSLCKGKSPNINIIEAFKNAFK
jgi:amino acid transporter